MSNRINNCITAIGAAMLVLMLVATYSVTSGKAVAWMTGGTQQTAAAAPASTSTPG
jgi:hypothetical protein